MAKFAADNRHQVPGNPMGTAASFWLSSAQGRRMISLDVCINLSNIFNVSIDYIIIGNVHLSDKEIISGELDKLMDEIQKIRDMIL